MRKCPDAGKQEILERKIRDIFGYYYDSNTEYATGIRANELEEDCERLAETAGIENLSGCCQVTFEDPLRPEAEKKDTFQISGREDMWDVMLNRKYVGPHRENDEDSVLSFYKRERFRIKDRGILGSLMSRFFPKQYDISLAFTEIARDRKSSINDIRVTVKDSGNEIVVEDIFAMRDRMNAPAFVGHYLNDLKKQIAEMGYPDQDVAQELLMADERNHGALFDDTEEIDDEEFRMHRDSPDSRNWHVEYMVTTPDGHKHWSHNYFHDEYQEGTITDKDSFKGKIWEAIFSVFHDKGELEDRLIVVKRILKNADKFARVYFPEKRCL